MEKAFEIFYVADCDIRFWRNDGVVDLTPRNGKWSYGGFISQLSKTKSEVVFEEVMDADGKVKGYYPVDAPMYIVPFVEHRKITNYNVVIGNKTVAIIGKQAYADIVADFPEFEDAYLPDIDEIKAYHKHLREK